MMAISLRIIRLRFRAPRPSALMSLISCGSSLTVAAAAGAAFWTSTKLIICLPGGGVLFMVGNIFAAAVIFNTCMNRRMGERRAGASRNRGQEGEGELE